MRQDIGTYMLSFWHPCKLLLSFWHAIQCCTFYLQLSFRTVFISSSYHAAHAVMIRKQCYERAGAPCVPKPVPQLPVPCSISRRKQFLGTRKLNMRKWFIIFIIYFISLWIFGKCFEEGKSCIKCQRQNNVSQIDLQMLILKSKNPAMGNYRSQTWPSNLYHVSLVPSLRRMTLYSTQRKQKVIFPSPLAAKKPKNQQQPFKFCPVCATGTGIVECPKCEGRGKLPHLIPPVPGTRPKMGEKKCKTCRGKVWF